MFNLFGIDPEDPQDVDSIEDLIENLVKKKLKELSDKVELLEALTMSELTKLNVKKGDVLVLKIADLDIDNAEYFQKWLAKKVPGVEVVVVDKSNVDFEVISPEEVPTHPLYE